MKRMQWLADQVANLEAEEFSEFRRWFLACEEAQSREEVERTGRHHAVDPRIVEALAEYGAASRAP